MRTYLLTKWGWGRSTKNPYLFLPVRFSVSDFGLFIVKVQAKTNNPTGDSKAPAFEVVKDVKETILTVQVSFFSFLSTQARALMHSKYFTSCSCCSFYQAGNPTIIILLCMSPASLLLFLNNFSLFAPRPVT
jgi:hypothetical protein